MKLLHAFCDPKDTMPVVSHMAGHYVYHNGAPYYDINAGKGCNILGYSNQEVLNFAKHYQAYNPSSDWNGKPIIWKTLEEQLQKQLPESYVAFIPSLTGSDSTDNALKIVWQYFSILKQKRQKVLVRKGSYHSGSISGWKMTNDQSWVKHLPDIEYVDFYDNNFNDIVEKYKDQISAVIIDTVSWFNGVDEISDDTLEQIKQGREKYDYKIIADEIFTGMFRFGHFADSIERNVNPDILCFGKALTAGYDNLALTIISDEILKVLETPNDFGWSDVLPIGNTRSQNPVGGACAVAAIEYCANNGIPRRLQTEVFPFINKLHKILQTHNKFTVTSKGSFLNCKIDGDVKIRNDIREYLNSHGIWIYATSNIKFYSFYEVESKETNRILEIFSDLTEQLNQEKPLTLGTKGFIL